MDAFPCCTDETQRPGMQARRSTRRSSRAGQMFTTVQCVDQLTVSVGRGNPVPAMRLAEAKPARQGTPPAPVCESPIGTTPGGSKGRQRGVVRHPAAWVTTRAAKLSRCSNRSSSIIGANSAVGRRRCVDYVIEIVSPPNLETEI